MTSIVQTVDFNVSISPDEFIKLYQGLAQDVVVTADDQRVIRFPAASLKKYLTHQGVQGRFRLSFDKNYKLIQIERLHP